MRAEDNLRALHPDQMKSGAPALEAAARAALNVRLDRILSDAEWASARHNLLEVAGIVRGWEQRAMAHQREDRAAEQQDKAA